MRRGMRYLGTALALLLVALLLVAALMVPDAVGGWYDRRALGQVKYTDMVYEPYEIVVYESFDEELRAMISCRQRGIDLYALEIEEGEDAPGDEELLALVNEELEKLCRVGLIGEQLRLESMEIRRKESLCPLGDCRECYPRNVYWWRLRCEIPDGWIWLTFDCAFHRIYSFQYFKRVCLDADLWEWREEQYGMTAEQRERLWYDYWEIPDGDSLGDSLGDFLYYNLEEYNYKGMYMYHGMQISN